jgi:nicotinate-nucleotide adenylyltransferase
MTELIGILGGTFDPLHNAHLELAAAARERLELDELRWIPAGIPPHRSPPEASAADRLEMVRLAIARKPGYILDDGEVRTGAPNYTVDTLARLRRGLVPDARLVLLMGADQLLGLDRWKDWLRLFELAHIGVAQRPGYALDTSTMSAVLRAAITRNIGTPDVLRREPAGRIVQFEMRPTQLSGSAVRERLRRGEDAADLLPAPVLAYIRSHRLYSSEQPRN